MSEMSKLSSNMWYLFKYGFLALLITGVLVNVLSRPGEGLDLIDRLGENFSDAYLPPTLDSYRISPRDVRVCLTHVSEQFWDNTLQNNTSQSQEERTLLSLLSGFSGVLSSGGVKGAIVEPGLLHCMVHQHYRALLSKRNFNVTEVPLAKNVVTLAVTGQDAVLLQQKDVLSKFSDAGFEPRFFVTPPPHWMKTNATSVASHALYRRGPHTVHLVVFYERGTYLWHGGLHDPSLMPGLHFARHSGAYEKFAFFPVAMSAGSPLYIPSTSHYFLLETLSSRFLECNNASSSGHHLHSKQSHHLGMAGDRFNRRAVTALRQLKSIFQPLLMNLWMWSGTLLGWYRDCDVIPWTSDVDFGAWASEVEDLSWIVHQLLDNKHVQIRELMGMQEEALEFNLHCYGLRTDLFFLYRIENGSWCSGHSPKQRYYFRYYYPPFTLCSAEWLGEKVQVACESEQVIESEYGPGWREPVSSWHYESSVKNRGPNIYWAPDKRTYIQY